jgi:predicted kinase
MAAPDRSCLPLFVFVSGKPGSGKSTLAQRLATALWFPLVSNDAIRQGLLETRAGAEEESARVVDGPTAVGVFYATIAFLLRAGVSLVAEFSFRRGLSEPDLGPLVQIARTVNVHCDTSIEEARRRFIEREQTQGRRFVEGMRRHRPDSVPRYGARHIIEQMERGAFDWGVFDPLDLDVPRVRVDTTADYAPSLDRIVEFICSASPIHRPQ